MHFRVADNADAISARSPPSGDPAVTHTDPTWRVARLRFRAAYGGRTARIVQVVCVYTLAWKFAASSAAAPEERGMFHPRPR
jgi:hypothetical protein